MKTHGEPLFTAFKTDSNVFGPPPRVKLLTNKFTYRSQTSQRKQKSTHWRPGQRYWSSHQPQKRCNLRWLSPNCFGNLFHRQIDSTVHCPPVWNECDWDSAGLVWWDCCLWSLRWLELYTFWAQSPSSSASTQSSTNQVKKLLAVCSQAKWEEMGLPGWPACGYWPQLSSWRYPKEWFSSWDQEHQCFRVARHPRASCSPR